MIVFCKNDLHRNIGCNNEKQTFKKGDAYVYWYLDSSFNNHQVEPIEGQPIIFNEEQFHKNFTLDPNYEKKY